MRAVVQRVERGSVTVDGDVIASVGHGFVVLLGVGRDDIEADADALADKLVGLRIFADDADRMNRSIVDVAGEVLLVSQFTLLGSIRKGRRPSFTAAAGPDHAATLVDYAAHAIRQRGTRVKTGRFGAMMTVEIVNDGPVTLVIDVAGGRVL